MNLITSLLLVALSGAILFVLITLIPSGSYAYETNKLILIVEIIIATATFIFGIISFKLNLRRRK